MSTRAVLYRRDLPGGGYVALDARRVEFEAASRPAAAAAIHEVRLLVERRAELARRAGHAPLVVAEERAEGEAAYEQTVAELQAIAADNVALAQYIRRWSRAAGGRVS